MSEKKSPPHKGSSSKGLIGDGKGNKRKIATPSSPTEEDDKKNLQQQAPKRKRPNIPEGSPEHIGLGSPRGAGSMSRLNVPLSERQQMALLKRMEEPSDTSPKSPSLGSQVSSTKRTPADKKVNKRNERGEAPLHMAAKKGDYKLTKRLIKSGASVNMKDYAGWTALHEACNSGNLRVAKCLLKAGADVNVQGFDDDTPLHDACSNGNKKLVHLLVRHGANPLQANLKGKTAFSLASVEIEPILRGNLAATYSSDSDSHSEEDSSDSIMSTKEEDRTVDEDLKLFKSEAGPSSSISSSSASAAAGLTPRRTSVPPSPDKGNNPSPSPRLFLKLQHKKSSSSSSATEEQQRVAEWNVLTVDSSEATSEGDLVGPRPSAFERKQTMPASGISSGISSGAGRQRNDDAWARIVQPSAGLRQQSQGGLAEGDGCPDSTVLQGTTVRPLPIHPLERTTTEPFTPRGIEGISSSDDEHLEVFAASSSGQRSKTPTTFSASVSCSSSVTSNINNKQQHSSTLPSSSSLLSSNHPTSQQPRQQAPRPYQSYHPQPHSQQRLQHPPRSQHPPHLQHPPQNNIPGQAVSYNQAWQGHRPFNLQQQTQSSLKLGSEKSGVSSTFTSSPSALSLSSHLTNSGSTSCQFSNVSSSSTKVSLSSSTLPASSTSSTSLPSHHQVNSSPFHLHRNNQRLNNPHPNNPHPNSQPSNMHPNNQRPTLNNLTYPNNPRPNNPPPNRTQQNNPHPNSQPSNMHPNNQRPTLNNLTYPNNPPPNRTHTNKPHSNSLHPSLNPHMNTPSLNPSSSSTPPLPNNHPSNHSSNVENRAVSSSLPYQPFSNRPVSKPVGSIVTGMSDRAAGSIVTGMSDRAVAASSTVSTPSYGATPSQPTSSVNSSHPLPDTRPGNPRIEELTAAQLKSDTSSCDSPLHIEPEDPSQEDNSENGSRPSTPKVPPLKIRLGGAQAADKIQAKQALPYVVNPTWDSGEEREGISSTSFPGEMDPLAAYLTGSNAGSDMGVTTTEREPMFLDNEDNCSRDSNRGEDGESGGEKGEDGKEKRPTRTLRSHTAKVQHTNPKDDKGVSDSGATKVTEKNGNCDPKEEGDNLSSTRSQKGEDSAGDDSSFPMRKRKLRGKTDPQPSPLSTAAPPPVRMSQPLEKPPNPYETYLNMRRQIASRHRSMSSVAPKPPVGFNDFLMVNCTYVLQGKVTSTLSVPMLPPPNLVAESMREFFIQQEKERYRLRLQHVIEREKLMLSIEQEILREHGRAARAMANQTLPFSVCTILREEEIYNQQELEQAEDRDKNVRSRYNGRQFLSWLQDVDDKYAKIKQDLVLRHHHEAESLYAVQKLDWEWKLKECGLCDHKISPVIDDLHVPLVAVSDEFELLPSS